MDPEVNARTTRDIDTRAVDLRASTYPVVDVETPDPPHLEIALCVCLQRDLSNG